LRKTYLFYVFIRKLTWYPFPALFFLKKKAMKRKGYKKTAPFHPFSSFFILFHPFSSKKAEKGRKRQKKAEKGRKRQGQVRMDTRDTRHRRHSFGSTLCKKMQTKEYKST